MIAPIATISPNHVSQGLGSREAKARARLMPLMTAIVVFLLCVLRCWDCPLWGLADLLDLEGSVIPLSSLAAFG